MIRFTEALGAALVFLWLGAVLAREKNNRTLGLLLLACGCILAAIASTFL